MDQKGAHYSFQDIVQFSEAHNLLRTLSEYSGSFEETLKFLVSDYHTAVPHVDISCKLWADLMTSNMRIERSDFMDIEYLSTVIPYCDFVITDDKRKNQLRKLEIDKTYSTRIYSLRETEIDALLAELEKL